MQTKDGMIIVHWITFSSIFLAQNCFSISQPIRQLFISIQNLIQLKNSLFMQVCQFLNLETLNSISSWSFPVRDFPTLLINHPGCSNQSFLLLIIMFFNFTPYVTPKHDFDLHQVNSFYQRTGKLGRSPICLRFSRFESEIMLDGMLNFKTQFMI